jgi:hypothetical protein
MLINAESPSVKMTEGLSAKVNWLQKLRYSHACPKTRAVAAPENPEQQQQQVL